MPASRCRISCELEVFDAALYFSESLDYSTTRRPIGQPAIRRYPPFSKSQSTTLGQLFEKERRSKLPSSPGAWLASFVYSFYQTKSKQMSSNIHQPPKSLQPNPPLYSNNGKKLFKRDYSDKSANDGPWLVHPAKPCGKSKTNFHEFLEYKVVFNKSTHRFLKDDRMWDIEVPSSLGGSFRKCDDPVDADNDDCDQSVCSSDLFELENYDV